jgi:hypothetical protein
VPKQRLSGLGVVTTLAALSLAAAFVLFKGLESTAVFKSQKADLGGAIAGFVVVFMLLRATYFKDSAESPGEATHARLQELQAALAENEKKRLLQTMSPPPGFRIEVAADLEVPFAISYPETWSFSILPRQFNYGVAKDEASAKVLGFGRNFNIVINDIARVSAGFDNMVSEARRSLSALIPNSSLMLSESFLLNGLPAARHRFDYTANAPDPRPPLTLYQVMLADAQRRYIFTISFTTTTADFGTSRPLFDNILSTFRI